LAKDYPAILGISKYYYGNKIGEDEMGDEYRTHRMADKYNIFFKNQKEIDLSENYMYMGVNTKFNFEGIG
jgi:hypothetical protein